MENRREERDKRRREKRYKMAPDPKLGKRPQAPEQPPSPPEHSRTWGERTIRDPERERAVSPIPGRWPDPEPLPELRPNSSCHGESLPDCPGAQPLALPMFLTDPDVPGESYSPGPDVQARI